MEAFDEGRLVSTDGLARAGRLRHAIDFLWGVNLSRALLGVSQDGLQLQDGQRRSGAGADVELRRREGGRCQDVRPHPVLDGERELPKRTVRSSRPSTPRCRWCRPSALPRRSREPAKGGRARASSLLSLGGPSTRGLPRLSTSQTFRRRPTGSSVTLLARHCRWQRGSTLAR